MNNHITCCLDCPRRIKNCHSNCKEYKSEREELDKRNEIIRKEKELDRILRYKF